MFSLILSVLSFVSCATADCGACDSSPTGQADPNPEDSGTGDSADTACPADCDSGDTADGGGTATLTYAVYKLGVLEDCLVSANDITESSGTAFEVPAPASYTVTAGDSSYTEQFGFPVHVDQDGEYWAAPPTDVSVQNNDAITGRFDLFNLFEPGDYACEYDSYHYDPSAPDLKGNYIETVEHDPAYVAVNESGKVEPEDEKENWDVVGSADDYMEVKDDHLSLEVVDTRFITYITESEIGKKKFSLTVVDETIGYVADLTCTK